MRSFKEIKSHYDFSIEDERLLASIRELMDDNVDVVMGALHSWVLQVDETARFFKDDKKKEYVFDSHKNWFHSLFAGNYDAKYYEKLLRIGQTHVRVSVDAHYMNRAINIVRNCCIDILNRNIEDTEQRTRLLISVEKMLDMNLDVITASYIEEELKAYSPTYRVRNVLISFSERPDNESCAGPGIDRADTRCYRAIRHGLKKPCHHRYRTWYYYSARVTSCAMDHYRAYEYRNQASEGR